MAKTKVVTNIRKDNGSAMTKAEVIFELTKASAISGRGEWKVAMQ